MTKKIKNESSVGGKIAMGASVAALAVGAYMLFGPDAKKNQKKVKGWAIKMKGEIIEKFEEVKDVTEPVYNKVVDEISAKYMKAKGMNADEVGAVVKDLKKHWKTISKTAKKAPVKAKKAVSKKK
jgi:hypothetical protein